MQTKRIGIIYTSPEGDGAHLLFEVTAQTGREALDIFNDEVGFGGCSHTHDCCGCGFTFPAEIIHHDKIYGYFILKQSYGRNI